MCFFFVFTDCGHLSRQNNTVRILILVPFFRSLYSHCKFDTIIMTLLRWPFTVSVLVMRYEMLFHVIFIPTKCRMFYARQWCRFVNNNNNKNRRKKVLTSNVRLSARNRARLSFSLSKSSRFACTFFLPAWTWLTPSSLTTMSHAVRTYRMRICKPCTWKKNWLWTWIYVNLHTPAHVTTCTSGIKTTAPFTSSIDWLDTSQKSFEIFGNRCNIKRFWKKNDFCASVSITYNSRLTEYTHMKTIKKLTCNMNAVKMWSSQIIYELMAKQCAVSSACKTHFFYIFFCFFLARAYFSAFLWYIIRLATHFWLFFFNELLQSVSVMLCTKFSMLIILNFCSVECFLYQKIYSYIQRILNLPYSDT